MGVKQPAHLSEGATNTAGPSPLKPSHLVHDEAFYTNSIAAGSPRSPSCFQHCSYWQSVVPSTDSTSKSDWKMLSSCSNMLAMIRRAPPNSSRAAVVHNYIKHQGRGRENNAPPSKHVHVPMPRTSNMAGYMERGHLGCRRN